MSKQVLNFEHLDKEAVIYKQKKEELIQHSENMKNTLLSSTKKEVEDVQNAINILNQKIDTVMKSPEVVETKNTMESCQQRMALSIEMAAKAFFKIKNMIQSKDTLTLEQKKQYEKKVYDKIISKFLNQEEIKAFEQMINSGSIMIMPNNRIGLN